MTELKVPPQTKKWTPPPPKLWFMPDEKRRPRPAAQYGPTAAAVASNVKRLRDQLGLSIYALAGRLEKAGRPITPSAVAKVEKQQRQVSVDDLTALAAALGVNPSALLLPVNVDPDDSVEVTGAGTQRAETFWHWADGGGPLPSQEEISGLPAGRAQYEAQLRFRQGRPHWLDEDAED
ncbi:helix-turn-helix domain-containing protein [Streptomyces sp. NPDC059165]|uniref:helix-turn-helix domain-containing protein n=1 Tax=Streptomyces sp. NPDC059165 TaxID=3346751 RepID=UPI00368F807A